MSRSMVALVVILLAMVSVFAAPIHASALDHEMDLESRITHHGHGTWFNVGLGRCGKWDKNGDAIVAIANSRYDHSKGGNCGQWMRITNKKNGKSAYGVVRDSCPSCGYNDLDLSPSLFRKLDSLSTGVIDVSWNFMNKNWSP